MGTKQSTQGISYYRVVRQCLMPGPRVVTVGEVLSFGKGAEYPLSRLRTLLASRRVLRCEAPKGAVKAAAEPEDDAPKGKAGK